jgi:hypothetical protein
LFDQANINRRDELARSLTESKYFAKAYVNRIWAHFFGRGFVEPVDDMGTENDPSHPELLNELAGAFAYQGYDPRRLIRWICLSDAYQLSCEANPTNDGPTAEPFFSRMLLKPMNTTQLFDSILIVTRGNRLLNGEQQQQMRTAWLRRLTYNLGNDESDVETLNGTSVEALLLMTDPDLLGLITAKEQGLVAQVVATQKSSEDILRQLYLAALNRPPTAREYEKVLKIQGANPIRGEGGEQFWQDVLWALLNSNEFILNH